jgi:ribosomal-protein-alanine N-acetyltransferase
MSGSSRSRGNSIGYSGTSGDSISGSATDAATLDGGICAALGHIAAACGQGAVIGGRREISHDRYVVPADYSAAPRDQGATRSVRAAAPHHQFDTPPDQPAAQHDQFAAQHGPAAQHDQFAAQHGSDTASPDSPSPQDSGAAAPLPCPLFLPARREHIPGIHAIEKLSFATPWSVESFEREFDDDLARYFVAICDGAVIGYCGYWSIVGEAHITNVAVHPCHRRRHVGIGLMRRMLRDIAENGIGHITLEAREDNRAAISMYEQLGFSRSGLRKNYYAKERKNAVIMWKHT